MLMKVIEYICRYALYLSTIMLVSTSWWSKCQWQRAHYSKNTYIRILTYNIYSIRIYTSSITVFLLVVCYKLSFLGLPIIHKEFLQFLELVPVQL